MNRYPGGCLIRQASSLAISARVCSSKPEPESSAEKETREPRSKSKKSSILNRNLKVSGFDAVYNFPFKRHGQSTINQAMNLSDQELTIIRGHETIQRNAKWRRRFLTIGSITAAYYYWYYYRPGTFSRVVNETFGSDVLSISDTPNASNSEQKGISKDSHTIWVYLSSHAAHIYQNATGDASGAFTGEKRTFVDISGFEQQVEQDSSDPWFGLPLHISVPVYYPYFAVGFALLFIPFVAVLHSSFNVTSRQMRLGQLGLPGEREAKEKFRFKTEQSVSTRINTVAGLTEAKHEVLEIIDFMKNPERYKQLGARLPKGVLLDGPPGVGKTLIAKAVAGEAVVPMVSCSGSEFEEVFVGVGAQRVRALFKQARKHSPCVVFIDEIDAFGKKRQNDGHSGSRGTLNALLSELDGFKGAEGIIVLAATNRSDVLDPALTRSGRFDRKISLENPPHKDRVEIAKVHLRPLTLDVGLDLDSAAEQLASLTPGCSGADIYNICNEAAIIASRKKLDGVDMACFHAALERVLVGMTKEAKKFTDDEKKRLAYHEAGHVVLQWFQSKTDPVVKASIVPRGGDKVGVTQKLPKDKFIRTQEELRQIMISHLGGYVAEELFFDDLSFNASEDLRKVTEMAYNEVCTYGMDPSVGHFHYEIGENAVTKPFGAKKEDDIDHSVTKIVAEASTRARDLLREHLEKVRTIGGLLLRNETLTAHELWRVLGERPEMSQEFRAFLEARH